MDSHELDATIHNRNRASSLDRQKPVTEGSSIPMLKEKDIQSVGLDCADGGNLPKHKKFIDDHDVENDGV